MSYPLFTGGSLQQFRSFELIGRSARRRRRQVLHRTTSDHLVETLDDLRIPPAVRFNFVNLTTTQKPMNRTSTNTVLAPTP
jgi:hypothetical protein